LVIDLDRREVQCAPAEGGNGTEHGGCRQLSEREAEILRYLACNRDRAIDRTELLHRVWGLNPRGIHTRTVDMHIARLREKLGDDCDDPRIIVTVRAKGYKLGDSVEVDEVAGRKGGA
jgi:DNA-binding response OmpR family regulator